jgi:hypothetical protein
MAMVGMARGNAAAARWGKRVERLERSGLSIRTFAAREGLKAGSLSRWKSKIRRERQVGAAAVTPLRFVELTAARPATPAPVFEVLLRSGRTVRVPDGFEAGELARLVSVLEEARP